MENFFRSPVLASLCSKIYKVVDGLADNGWPKIFLRKSVINHVLVKFIVSWQRIIDLNIIRVKSFERKEKGAKFSIFNRELVRSQFIAKKWTINCGSFERYRGIFRLNRHFTLKSRSGAILMFAWAITVGVDLYTCQFGDSDDWDLSFKSDAEKGVICRKLRKKNSC